MKLQNRRVLLIIGGGIAAYKVLELIRRLRDEGAKVRCVMTAAAAEFVTPLSVATLSADRVFSNLFDRDDEHDVGHIRLSREADLVVVAPATADLMAKAATGAANDLASAVLLVASLSYLGIGVSPPTPAWGLLVKEGQPLLQMAPWVVIFPCVVIAIVSVGSVMFGEVIRRRLTLPDRRILS